MKLYTDWRFLTILSIICWGLWGFLSKLVSNKLECGTILVLLCIGAFIVALVTTPTSFIFKLDKAIFIGLLAGIFCGFGYYFFYRALTNGEASAVIPISSLYIVVAAVLAIIFMNEPLTWSKIGGILAAVVAILLLSK